MFQKRVDQGREHDQTIDNYPTLQHTTYTGQVWLCRRHLKICRSLPLNSYSSSIYQGYVLTMYLRHDPLPIAQRRVNLADEFGCFLGGILDNSRY